MLRPGWLCGRNEGGSADSGGGAGLHPERVEGWIPDWRGVVSSVSAGGPGGGQCDDFDRHDAAAAGGDLDAIEDSAFRDGRRMESAGGPVDQEFLTFGLMTERVNGTGPDGGDDAEGVDRGDDAERASAGDGLSW